MISKKNIFLCHGNVVLVLMKLNRLRHSRNNLNNLNIDIPNLAGGRSCLIFAIEKRLGRAY